MKVFNKFARYGIASLIFMTSPIILAGSPMMEVNIRDLNKNPDKFAGEQVVVTGKVTRIEGPGAFIVEGSGFFNNKILVVLEGKQQAGKRGQQPGATVPVIKENQKIQLTGKVEQIGIAKIEEKYTPLKTEIKEEIEGNIPVLVVPPNGIKITS